uniref:Uncharacterized protein n=1 Tax=Rhizophagus irregularis (strain DAOM 181602 / DAOM 197198 / MUCL 43194) TaxID=747089 RepID=U9U7C0_RHIID
MRRANSDHRKCNGEFTEYDGYVVRCDNLTTCTCDEHYECKYDTTDKIFETQ